MFHFTARSGWINDPHGITFRDGGYDVFFQFVPESVVWALNCHWGHARGPDLLSLAELPVALAPGDGDDGIWTGSIAEAPDGTATLFYTSVKQPDIGVGTVRAATPTDDTWLAWTKGPQVAEAPAGLDLATFRDPFVTAGDTGWNMFVGGGGSDGTAMALRFGSGDLATWTYEGVTLQRSTDERLPVWMGALWECPQFFELGGASVMISSVWDDDVLYYAGFAMGELRDGQFAARTWGQLSFGPSYYAPSLFRDAEGRPSVVFWIRGVDDPAAGWAGAHSIPYLLGVSGDQLTASFHPDLGNYLAAPVAAGEPIEGLAALVSWAPDGPGSRLVISSGDVEVLRVSVSTSGLRVEDGSQSWEVPYRDGSIELLLDGPIAELAAPDGVFAVPIAPRGTSLLVTADSSALTVRPLARS